MQKDIGNYIVHSDGKVWSKSWNRFMNPQIHIKGYHRLGINKKKILLHRLIAQSFIPNPDNLLQINHKNGNKLDNRVENLEWCDQSHNMRHAFLTGLNKSQKLTECEVKKIKYQSKDLTHKEIAKIYNVSRSHISSIKQNKSRQHI